MPEKIIKSIKRSVLAQANEAAKEVAEAPPRPVAQTVNSWVKEWREQKQARAQTAYRQFLGDARSFAHHS